MGHEFFRRWLEHPKILEGYQWRAQHKLPEERPFDAESNSSSSSTELRTNTYSRTNISLKYWENFLFNPVLGSKHLLSNRHQVLGRVPSNAELNLHPAHVQERILARKMRIRCGLYLRLGFTSEWKLLWRPVPDNSCRNQPAGGRVASSRLNVVNTRSSKDLLLTRSVTISSSAENLPVGNLVLLRARRQEHLNIGTDSNQASASFLKRFHPWRIRITKLLPKRFELETYSIHGHGASCLGMSWDPCIEMNN